jgi:hypothetical protein
VPTEPRIHDTQGAHDQALAALVRMLGDARGRAEIQVDPEGGRPAQADRRPLHHHRPRHAAGCSAKLAAYLEGHGRPGQDGLMTRTLPG